MRKKNTSLLTTPLTFQSLQAASFQLNKAPRRTADAGSCTTDTKEGPGHRQSGSSITAEGGVPNYGSNASEDNYAGSATALKKSGMPPAGNVARDLGLLKPTRKRQDVLPSGSHIKRRPRSVARHVPIHNTASTQFAKLSEKPSQETMAPLTQISSTQFSSSQNVAVGAGEKATNRSRDLVRPSHYERRADPSPAPSRPLRRTRRKANRQPFLTPPATVLSVGDGTPTAFIGSTLRAMPSQASDTGSLTALPIPSPPVIGAGGSPAGGAAALASRDEAGRHAGAGPDSPVAPGVQAGWNLVGRAASSSNNTAAASTNVMYPRRRDSMYAKLTHMASENSAAASPHLPVFTTAATGALAQGGGRRGIAVEGSKRGVLNASASSSTAGHPPSGRGGGGNGVTTPKSPKPNREVVLETYVTLCHKLGETPYEEWVSALSRSSLTLDAQECVLHRVGSENEDQMLLAGSEERSQSPLTVSSKATGGSGRRGLRTPQVVNHATNEAATSASSSYASSNNNNNSTNHGGASKACEPTATSPAHAAPPLTSALGTVAGNVQGRVAGKGGGGGSVGSNASSTVNAMQPTCGTSAAAAAAAPATATVAASSSSSTSAAAAASLMRPTLFAANMRSRVAAGRCVDQVRAYCEQHLQPYVSKMDLLQQHRQDVIARLAAFQRSCADSLNLSTSDEFTAGQTHAVATTMERRAQRLSSALEGLQQATVQLLLSVEECSKAIGKPIGTVALEPEAGQAVKTAIVGHHGGGGGVATPDGTAETVLPHARHGTAQGSASATTATLGGHPFPLNVLSNLAGAPPRGYVDFVRRQEKEVMTELRGVVDAVRAALRGTCGAAPVPSCHFRVEDETVFDTPLFLPPALLLRGGGGDAGCEGDEDSHHINSTTSHANSRRSSEENQQRPRAGRTTTGLTPRKSVYRTATTPRNTTVMGSRTSTLGTGSSVKTPRTTTITTTTTTATATPSAKTPRHTSGSSVLQRSSSQHAGAMRSLHTNHTSSGSAGGGLPAGGPTVTGKTDGHGGRPPVAPLVTPSFVFLTEPATHGAEAATTSVPPTPTLLLRCTPFSRQTSGGSGNGTGNARAAPALPPPRGANVAGRTRSRSASVGAGRKPMRRSRSAALRSGVSPAGNNGSSSSGAAAASRPTTDAVGGLHAVIAPTLTRAMLRDALVVWQTLVALAALTSKAQPLYPPAVPEAPDVPLATAAVEQNTGLPKQQQQRAQQPSLADTLTEGIAAATVTVVDPLFVTGTHSPPDIAVTEERHHDSVGDADKQDEKDKKVVIVAATTVSQAVEDVTTTMGDGGLSASLTPKLETELMGAAGHGRAPDATTLVSVVARTLETVLSAPQVEQAEPDTEDEATTRTLTGGAEATQAAGQRHDGPAPVETEQLPPSAELVRAGAVIAGYMQASRARRQARRERCARLVDRERQVQAAQLDALHRRCVERFLRRIIYRLRHRRRRQLQLTSAAREAAWATRTSGAPPGSPVTAMTTRERFQRARAQRQAITAPSKAGSDGGEAMSASAATAAKRLAGAAGAAMSLSPRVEFLDEIRRAPLPLIESGISTRDIANYNRDAESFEVAALHRLLRAPAALLYLVRMLVSRYPTCPPMAYAPHKDAARSRPAASPDRATATEVAPDQDHASPAQPPSAGGAQTDCVSATRLPIGGDEVYHVSYAVFCWHLLYHASLADIRDEHDEARLSGGREGACGYVKSQHYEGDGDGDDGAAVEVRRLTGRRSGGYGSMMGRQGSVARGSTLHNGLAGSVVSNAALHRRLRRLSAPFTVSYRSYADPDELRHRTPVVKDFARPFERWGCAHQLLRRVFTAAAIYAWKVIFSHTPHDDYKQRQLRTEKDRAERIERVCQRNHMILTCYGVRSEREWLREANNDLSFVGQLVSPRRALELDDREDEQQIKDTYDFVEDFLYQCFPTINALDDIPSFLIGAGVYFALKEVCHYGTDAPDAFSFIERFPGLVVSSAVSDNVYGGDTPGEHGASLASSASERRITWYQHTVLGRYELIRNLHHLCRACDAAQHGSRHSTAVRGAAAVGDAADSATLSALDALEKATRSAAFCDEAAKCGRQHGNLDGARGGGVVLVNGEAAAYLAAKDDRQQQLRPGVVLACVPPCALLYGTHSSAQFLRQRDSAVCKALTLWTSEAAVRSSDISSDVMRDGIARSSELCVLFRKHFLVSLSTRLTMLLFGLRVDLEFCEGLDCIE